MLDSFSYGIRSNPQIVKYITNNNTLEINNFLGILYDYILTTIKNNKSGIKE